MNEHYFNLQMKDHYKLYVFEKKNICAFFNVLVNFVGENVANSKVNTSIIAPYPFVNCSYNEGTVLYQS